MSIIPRDTDATGRREGDPCPIGQQYRTSLCHIGRILNAGHESLISPMLASRHQQSAAPNTTTTHMPPGCPTKGNDHGRLARAADVSGEAILTRDLCNPRGH